MQIQKKFAAILTSKRNSNLKTNLRSTTPRRYRHPIYPTDTTISRFKLANLPKCQSSIDSFLSCIKRKRYVHGNLSRKFSIILPFKLKIWAKLNELCCALCTKYNILWIPMAIQWKNVEYSMLIFDVSVDTGRMCFSLSAVCPSVCLWKNLVTNPMCFIPV